MKYGLKFQVPTFKDLVIGPDKSQLLLLIPNGKINTPHCLKGLYETLDRI